MQGEEILRAKALWMTDTTDLNLLKTSVSSVSSVVKFKSLFRQCRALPHFIVPNATLYRPKCHTLSPQMPQVSGGEVWHSGRWSVAFRPDHGDKQIAFSHKPFHYSQTRVDIQKATAAVDSYSDDAVIISLINYNLLLLFILFHVVFCAPIVDYINGICRIQHALCGYRQNIPFICSFQHSFQGTPFK